MDMISKVSASGLIGLGDQKLNLDDVVIHTERLILRPITTEYAEVIFEEFTPEVTRYMVPSSPKEIGETLAFIRGTTELRKTNSELVAVILNKKTGEFLGGCGLHGRKNPREPEFGIWLKTGAHGHGYGKEAIHGLYDWAVKNVAVDAFIYPVDKANTPSRKIPESLGGVVVFEVMAPTMSGGTLDEVIYRIPVKSE